MYNVFTDQSPVQTADRKKKQVLGDFSMFKVNKEFENFWFRYSVRRKREVVSACFSVNNMSLLNTICAVEDWTVRVFMKLAKQTSDSVRLRSNIEILIDMFNHQATRPDKTRQIPVQSLPLLTTTNYNQKLGYPLFLKVKLPFRLLLVIDYNITIFTWLMLQWS